MLPSLIPGFSKLSKEEKIRIISGQIADGDAFRNELSSLDHKDHDTQKLLEHFSENTLGNYPLPFGIAPNFLINGNCYNIPMVTEESSVVAAAASAAKFWSEKGGFHCRIQGTVKTGQVHFLWEGEPEYLMNSIEPLRNFLLLKTRHLTERMEQRGGGIKNISISDYSESIKNYYQLNVEFETADSMGANFINSVLEEMAEQMKIFYTGFSSGGYAFALPDIIMAILSNYTPSCKVECYVESEMSSFESLGQNMSGKVFAEKFKMAVDIAQIDPFRAVTHNKGIFNGIDAVVMATANDFRAVEAGGHAWASKNGRYKSLSKVEITRDLFRFSLEIPLAVGTVGGLTSLHPIAKWSYRILNNPGAEELMMIIASAGLASNFSAIKALITKGIQQGHMKMHLGNILTFLGATRVEKEKATAYFHEKKVSHHDVEQFLLKIRGGNAG